MSNIIQQLEQEEIARLTQGKTIPEFAPGDTVVVQVKVKEGNRERLQAYEGVVIAKRNRGLNSAFIVRKISSGEGVERTFQTYSPLVASIEVKRRGDVRRAKLYYLRDRVGKAARVAERRWGIDEDVLDAEEAGALDVEGEVQEEAEVEVVPAESEGEETAEAEKTDEGEPAAEADAEATPEGEAAPEASAEDENADAGADGDDQAGESEEDSTEDEASERDG